MQIRLNNYFGFIIKALLPSWILTFLCIIGMSVSFVINPVGMKDCTFLLIILILMFVVFVIILLIIKFKKPSVWYLFDDEKIQICDKHGIVEEIKICDIEFIHYRSFKFRYLVTIFSGELNECGAWRLYIQFKDGKSRKIGLFDVKSVEKIKQQYGELVSIL